MSSKYDNIQTAADMVNEVMIHGLSLNQEDLCRVQDIFGHSTIEELDLLANDIGRNNEHGHPDPKGTWSSGRRPTRDVFYMILFNIWNWEDATRFWNQHSNPEREELLELRTTWKEWRDRSDHLEEIIDKEREEKLEEIKLRCATEEKVVQLESELKAKELEIIQLKAKLYDLIMSDK